MSIAQEEKISDTEWADRFLDVCHKLVLEVGVIEKERLVGLCFHPTGDEALLALETKLEELIERDR